MYQQSHHCKQSSLCVLVGMEWFYVYIVLFYDSKLNPFMIFFFSQWQYRMHPEICKFPSLHFYDNKLLNGSQMSNKSAPFHQINGLGPYVFYDIIDGQEVRGKSSGVMSLCNEHEADAAVEILKLFKKRLNLLSVSLTFSLS